MRIRFHLPRIIALLALCSCLVRAEGPDFATPEMQQLRTDYLAQKTVIAKQRADGLRALLDDQVGHARQMAAKARISGNITGQAAANTAVRLFTEAKAAFDQNGAYAITNSVRRDLEATVDLFKTNARVIEDRQTAALGELDQTFAAKLGAVLAQRKTPEDDSAKRLALLAQLAGAVAPAAPATNGAPTAAVAPTNAAPQAASNAVLGTSGQAVAWTPLVRLEIVVHDAVEVVKVPLAGLTAPRTSTGVGGMGQPWSATATPLQELIPGEPAPAFRAQSAPPLKPVDVLNWPSARNNWTIELRTKTETLPSQHGVVIEVDASAARALAGNSPIAGTPARAAGPPAKVGFDTQPAGAAVIVDGRPLLTDDRKPLLTPCITVLPSGPTDLRFRKRGYQDLVMKQALVASNIVFRTRLVEIPGYEERTVVIAATGPEWTATGVHVKKGNQVRIAATGQWSCAAGGELVDADGYPNNDRFFRYYLNPAMSPRLFKLGNYGQLLARIQPGGEPEAVGKEGAFSAAADGEIQLTINEPVAARRDNHGQLTVRVTVDP